jgi:hypothetical protein
MNRKSAPASSSLPLSFAALGLAALGCVFQASPARALEEGAGEAKAIDACDKRLCTILQQKNPSGEDLKCLLTKTWAKSSLKGDRTVGWGFGDARCTIQIDISRARIVATVTDKETKFAVPAHTAHCIVEQDGEVKTVKATLAPKIIFKGGRAEKIWINLLHVEGPTAIKATMTTAAQLNDTIGLFHRNMLKAVNGYIYKHCPKEYPLTQSATATPAKRAPVKPANPAQPAQPATPKKQEGG